MTSSEHPQIPHAASPFVFGEDTLTIAALDDLRRGLRIPILGERANAAMAQSCRVVEKLRAEEVAMYGVSTSLGASVDTPVPDALSDKLSLNLLRFHGCGTGRTLTDLEVAAVLAARIQSLAHGKSGIRPIVAERLVLMLQKRVFPVIPAEGSVGASGDLTPLSYVAATIVGEREVRVDGVEMPASEWLASEALDPIPLVAKEALALMNGTSVACAMASCGWLSAQRLSRLTCHLTAMVSDAVQGNPTHFDAFIHNARPHRGQIHAAQRIASALHYDPTAPPHDRRLQDRYSLRCAPHVIGVAFDSLEWTKHLLETELNGVSDNPVVDVAREMVLHGGNFYGGHVSAAADTLKTAVANLADLMDRQLMLLCNKSENAGLGPNLVGVHGEEACIHNGFKAVTIATSAIAAEALKLTMPASVFSRSTELHNQDKVPMAPIAVRDLLRINELSETIAAMLCLAAAQGLFLRGLPDVSPTNRAMYERIREHAAPLVEDRRLDHDIYAVHSAIQEGVFDDLMASAVSRAHPLTNAEETA